MLKRFLSFLFLSFAVLALSIGLVLLFTRHQLLSSEFYKEGFLEADFYNQAAAFLEQNIPVFMENNLNIREEGEFGPRLMSKFIPKLLDKMDFADILQLMIENNADNLTSWLKGSKDLEIYFPKDALVESYKENVGDDQFFRDFLETSGYYELPNCFTETGLATLNSEDTGFTCQSPIIEAGIQQKLTAGFPAEADNLAEGFLISMMPELDEKTPATRFDLTQDQKDRIEQIPKLVKIPLYLSIGMITLSLLSAFVAAKLSPSPKSTVIRTILYSGILITTTGLLVKLVLKFVFDFLLQANIPIRSDKFSEEQVMEILVFFESLLVSILGSLLTTLVSVGVILVVFSMMIYLGFWIYQKAMIKNSLQPKISSMKNPVAK